MTAITQPRLKSAEPIKIVMAGDLAPEARQQMDQLIRSHTDRRARQLDVRATLRSGQRLADYKYEIDTCAECGPDQPAINIDQLRLTLQTMV